MNPQKGTNNKPIESNEQELLPQKQKRMAENMKSKTKLGSMLKDGVKFKQDKTRPEKNAGEMSLSLQSTKPYDPNSTTKRTSAFNPKQTTNMTKRKLQGQMVTYLLLHHCLLLP